MHLKSAALFMNGFALCLLVATAGAQTTDDERQAVRADQQALDDAYRQLQQDRLTSNSAGIEIDQDNIETAQQDFLTDEQRTIADDQKAVAADQQDLEAISQRLQQDQQAGNTGAVTADENDLKAAQQKFQADKQQTIADDGLEVTRNQQALDNENRQLQEDMRENTDAVLSDEENVKETTQSLQTAQLKLQIDKNNPELSH